MTDPDPDPPPSGRIALGCALCEAVGLDPNQTTSFTLTIKASDGTTVAVATDSALVATATVYITDDIQRAIADKTTPILRTLTWEAVPDD
ncbi:MAG: hypothetical protein GY925_17695 [Actinomycetia bacterium]|nr:hypothetical protein [Actinomycetes bacterium]